MPERAIRKSDEIPEFIHNLMLVDLHLNAEYITLELTLNTAHHGRALSVPASYLGDPRLKYRPTDLLS
jgi:hypothetical protein